MESLALPQRGADRIVGAAAAYARQRYAGYARALLFTAHLLGPAGYVRAFLLVQFLLRYAVYHFRCGHN